MMFQPKTKKQEQLVEAVRKFLPGGVELDLPPIDEVFEKQMYEISLALDTEFEEVEKMIELVKQSAAEAGEPVTCSKGCDYCCTQPIMAMLPETITIVQYLDFNPEIKEMFLSKYSGWRGQVNIEAYIQGVRGSLKQTGLGPEISDADLVKLYDGGKNVSCPFLEEHECTVYPVRPFVCRKLMSLDDPEICRSKGRIMKEEGSPSLSAIIWNATLVNLGLLQKIGIKKVVSSMVPSAVFGLNEERKAYLESYKRTAYG